MVCIIDGPMCLFSFNTSVVDYSRDFGASVEVILISAAHNKTRCHLVLLSPDIMSHRAGRVGCTGVTSQLEGHGLHALHSESFNL